MTQKKEHCWGHSLMMKMESQHRRLSCLWVKPEKIWIGLLPNYLLLCGLWKCKQSDNWLFFFVFFIVISPALFSSILLHFLSFSSVFLLYSCLFFCAPLPPQNPSDVVYRFVELRVLTNWGHVEYTCLYRFRVHGQIASTWDSRFTDHNVASLYNISESTFAKYAI